MRRCRDVSLGERTARGRGKPARLMGKGYTTPMLEERHRGW